MMDCYTDNIGSNNPFLIALSSSTATAAVSYIGMRGTTIR